MEKTRVHRKSTSIPCLKRICEAECPFISFDKYVFFTPDMIFNTSTPKEGSKPLPIGNGYSLTFSFFIKETQSIIGLFDSIVHPQLVLFGWNHPRHVSTFAHQRENKLHRLILLLGAQHGHQEERGEREVGMNPLPWFGNLDHPEKIQLRAYP